MAKDFGFRDNKLWVKKLFLVDDNGVHHELRMDTTGNLLIDGKISNGIKEENKT